MHSDSYFEGESGSVTIEKYAYYKAISVYLALHASVYGNVQGIDLIDI